ncbi:hypothetical protein, partial [Cognatiluteimonas telluris]|uniref:hypothetical protein n=1 Tax=Cognatiluteimonas telluris TaxID=1104775 RepID=UPI001A9C4B22
MVARRTRVVLLAAAVVLAWLAFLAPQLWPERFRVAAFLGIVAMAAWGWGRRARVRATHARRADALPAEVAASDAGLARDGAPLAADLVA